MDSPSERQSDSKFVCVKYSFKIQKASIGRTKRRNRKIQSHREKYILLSVISAVGRPEISSLKDWNNMINNFDLTHISRAFYPTPSVYIFLFKSTLER